MCQLYQSGPLQDLPNSELTFSELTRFSTWFAKYPEKICGVQQMTSSFEFPIRIVGDQNAVTKAINDTLINNKPIQDIKNMFEHGLPKQQQPEQKESKKDIYNQIIKRTESTSDKSKAKLIALAKMKMLKLKFAIQ